MSRNFIFSDASSEASVNRQNALGNTQSRIFGDDVDYEKIDKKSAQAKKKDEEAKKALEAAEHHDEVQDFENNHLEFDRNKQQNQSSHISEAPADLSRMSQHSIRYSSFLDENLSNSNRIHDQQSIQKHWLDHQIEERNEVDRKNKMSEDLYDQSLIQRDAFISSQSQDMKHHKQDVENEIRDYNEVMANQKRANDKKMKELDRQEANDDFQNASKQEFQRQYQEVDNNQSEFDRNKQQNQSSHISEASSDLFSQHPIRYSSFMDESRLNTNRLHDQQSVQKHYLDEQVAQHKEVNRENKKSEDLYDESVFYRNALTSSHSQEIKHHKQDIENEIRDYNEAMANLKRAKDKKMKELDQQEANGNFQKASQQELQMEEFERQHQEDIMIEKERAMSREMRQMNTNN